MQRQTIHLVIGTFLLAALSPLALATDGPFVYADRFYPTTTGQFLQDSERFYFFVNGGERVTVTLDWDASHGDALELDPVVQNTFRGTWRPPGEPCLGGEGFSPEPPVKLTFTVPTWGRSMLDVRVNNVNTLPFFVFDHEVTVDIDGHGAGSQAFGPEPKWYHQVGVFSACRAVNTVTEATGAIAP